MTDSTRRTVGRHEGQLVYAAVAVALAVELSLEDINALAENSNDLQDVIAAVQAMRKERDHRLADPTALETPTSVVNAGLATLRERAAARRNGRNPGHA